MDHSPSIVWFTNNLRLADNRALTTAAARGAVVPVFIFDEAVDTLGGASKWWLRVALHVLSADLAKHKISLILRRGNPAEVLHKLVKETGARHVDWSRHYEPALAARDAQIESALADVGIEATPYSGFLLFEPRDIRTGAGTPFKVFTPFSRACFAASAPVRPLPVPTKMRGVEGVASDNLDNWHLVPKKAEWPKGLAQAWKVGEKAAHERLHLFIDEILSTYKTARDRPDQDGTSRLSPYLHFGHISPRQIWHAIGAHESGAKYLQEILWREFSWHLLNHIPDFTTQPLQKSFMHFPWRDDEQWIQAWQRGQTGYPIVDAGMRQLWQTGWMHNRVRMIVASFLIKDLLVDWRQGMAWFWDTLVDADLGSNTASWQWVAGCGADAAPYFRIFNPTLQGQKFDPNGDYVRRFVPELAKLDNKYIHEPWKAPPEALAKAGVKLGKNYPVPMVDHGKARQRALNALKMAKNGGGLMPELPDLFD